MPITPSTRSGSARCCRCGSKLCATPAGSERSISRRGSISLRGLRRGRRVPLAAAHARDLDALEQAGLAERLVARERLRLRAARHVEDEAAADAPDAVVGDERAAQHQDVPVLFEIGEVRVPVGDADLGAVVAVFLVDDVEHAFLPLPDRGEGSSTNGQFPWPLGLASIAARRGILPLTCGIFATVNKCFCAVILRGEFAAFMSLHYDAAGAAAWASKRCC